MKNKMNKHIIAVLMLGAFGAFSLGAMAQTVPALTCSPGSSTILNGQSLVLTANGGIGGYVWSGPGATSTVITSNTFSGTYPDPGSYMVTVSSGTQSANCFITVTASGSSTGGATNPVLSCSPANQSVTVGTLASVSASGGTGSYSWSAPDLIISNPVGSGFSASYTSPGIKTITLRSGSQAAICNVTVVGNATVPVPTPTPGLPNTGGGFGK